MGPDCATEVRNAPRHSVLLFANITRTLAYQYKQDYPESDPANRMKAREMLEYSNLIRLKREGLGLTQKAFSELLGMKENGERTIRGWENGEHRPTHTKLNQILNLPDRAPFKLAENKTGENYKFTFIDLFAGIGGIRLPFQELGGKCVFSSEWDKFSQKTYAANFGEIPHGDITKISATQVPAHDVLLAGFPCQAFSQAGLKQGFMDTRGTLFFEIQKILAHHDPSNGHPRPKAFLLENVKQLKGHDQGRTLRTILNILQGNERPEIPMDVSMSTEARDALSQPLQYQVSYEVLRACDFGVPQNRERVYIVGFDREQVSTCNVKDIAKEIFDELKQRKSETSVGSILEPDENVDPKYTISDRLYAGHIRRKKEHLQKGNGFGFSVFNRRDPHTNTISARYYKDGSEILIDQSHLGANPRKLTPRECARLQGFPENFVIDAVSDVQNYRQFGNSVSVPVIRAIAEKMTRYL